MCVLQTIVFVSALCIDVSSDVLSQTSTSAHDEKEVQLDASGILSRVEGVYAKCRTYVDSGSLTIRFVESGGVHTEERPFSTAFIRPDRFRYEFRSTNSLGESQRYLIWKDKDDVRRWWDVDNQERRIPLSRAVAGAAGVSGGSTLSVPSLLFPHEIGGRRPTQLEHPSRAEDSFIDGAECYCIKGSTESRLITLWVEKKHCLLLRIDVVVELDGFRTESSCVYRPVIDAEVKETALMYDPPKR
jgi:hypothetical protein